MNLFKKTLQIFHLLSLNVVLGAVISSSMFWLLPDGNGIVNIPSLALLGICTWIIYILDRLLDLKIYPVDFSERHSFHAHNQYNLSVLLVMLVCVAAVLCFFIPEIVFWYGLGLSSVLGIYFLVLTKLLKNNKMQWLKEPTTAICYCLAVVGISFVHHTSINLSSWVLAFMFFLIVSQNLLIFSYFEKLSEVNLANTVDFFGKKTVLRLIRIIGFIILFLAVFLFSNGWDYSNKVGLILAIMSQTLGFMSYKTSFFLRSDKYRWIGDGVFLLPILLLI